MKRHELQRIQNNYCCPNYTAKNVGCTKQQERWLTSLSDSNKIWSYSLKATKKIIDVTFSKQWIHFLRSDRWPPTSTILQKKQKVNTVGRGLASLSELGLRNGYSRVCLVYSTLPDADLEFAGDNRRQENKVQKGVWLALFSPKHASKVARSPCTVLIGTLFLKTTRKFYAVVFLALHVSVQKVGLIALCWWYINTTDTKPTYLHLSLA